MAWLHPDAIAYQRKRWNKPDDGRWTRPDVARWLKPDPESRLSPAELQAEHPELYERKYGSVLRHPAPSSQLCDRLAARAPDTTIDLPERDWRDDPEVRRLVAEIKFDLLRLQYWRKAYNPNQPRVPAGNSDGGQWTSDGSQIGRIQLAENRNSNVLTDAWGDRYYNPGGHHEMARGVYRHWNLRPETRRVFDQATTGPIPEVGLRETPDGPAYQNAWRDPGGGLHRSYNDAVRELGDGFLKRNGISPEQMTPDQARSLLKEIRESDDPRIRDFNSNMRRIRRLFRLRPGSD